MPVCVYHVGIRSNYVALFRLKYFYTLLYTLNKTSVQLAGAVEYTDYISAEG